MTGILSSQVTSCYSEIATFKHAVKKGKLNSKYVVVYYVIM